MSITSAMITAPEKSAVFGGGRTPSSYPPHQGPIRAARIRRDRATNSRYSSSAVSFFGAIVR